MPHSVLALSRPLRPVPSASSSSASSYTAAAAAAAAAFQSACSPYRRRRAHRYHHQYTYNPPRRCDSQLITVPLRPRASLDHNNNLHPQPPRNPAAPLSTLDLLRHHHHSAPTPAMSTETIEEAKKSAAIRAVADHFDPAASYVGIGSGTTIIYVVEAIKERSTNPHIRFVPTGYQSRQVIVNAGLTPILFDSLPENTILDVAFDGADEVDEELNCIKGGGACLFQEKLVVERARKFVCVADYRKAQPRLLTNWPSIPIEVAPIASATVLRGLRELGSPNPTIRTNPLLKSGPLKTDQGFFIVDAPFPPLLTAGDVAAGRGAGDGVDGVWEVERLSRAIKLLTGVLEVGLFAGPDGPAAIARGATGGQKPVAVYFGMPDGSVQVRVAPAKA